MLKSITIPVMFSLKKTNKKNRTNIKKLEFFFYSFCDRNNASKVKSFSSLAFPKILTKSKEGGVWKLSQF